MRIGFILLAASILLVSGVSAAEEQGEKGEPTTLQEAILWGQIHMNLRLRSEIVDQDGFETSQAFTERLRLGYGSKSFKGFSFYVEFEDIRAADDDRYNAAGLNANPDKAVIADPEDTELNQAYIRYAAKYLSVTGGRQRIILDDHRFVGNVGWRQNEQTYDAATLTSEYFADWRFFYSYLWDVNRIFGPDADRDFESDTHLVNVSYSGLGIGKLVGFAYFLDFDNAPASSSNTFGLRFTGENALSDKYSLSHVVSFATQSDAGDNRTEYDAHYYLAEAKLTREELGHAGGGFEVLGSDDEVASFQTPLATLHGENGWADVFLTTPAAGLQDLYIFAGAELVWGVQGQAIFHWFRTEEGGKDLGEEIDVIMVKKLTENISLLAKFADFDGNGSNSDRTKFWLQTEFKF